MGLDANRDLVRLWLKESDNVPQLKEVVERELNRPAATWIADYLGAKVKAGELVEHDCEAVGTIALGAITAWWIWQQVAGPVGPTVDRDRFVVAWVDLLLRLAPPSPRSSSRSR